MALWGLSALCPTTVLHPCATLCSSAKKEVVGLTLTLQIRKWTKKKKKMSASWSTRRTNNQADHSSPAPHTNSNPAHMPASPGASSPAPESNIQTHYQITALENQAITPATGEEAQQPVHLSSPCGEHAVTGGQGVVSTSLAPPSPDRGGHASLITRRCTRLK